MRCLGPGALLPNAHGAAGGGQEGAAPEVQQTAVAPLLLGFVEGFVGEQQELAAGLDIELGKGGRTGAEGQRDTLPLVFQLDRLDRQAQALRQIQRRLAVGVLEQQGELLAAVAAAQVVLAAMGLQRLREDPQGVVTGGVAVGVVGFLEVVDVTQGDRHRPALLAAGAVGLL